LPAAPKLASATARGVTGAAKSIMRDIGKQPLPKTVLSLEKLAAG
jgi:hypothetical protein